MFSRLDVHSRRWAAVSRVLTAVCIGVGLSACAGGRVPAVTVPPRPLGRDVPAYLPPPTDRGRPDGPTVRVPTDSISLREAVALALLHSPDLGAFAWETRAREARVLQAGRAPNPVVGVIAEDIGATNSRGGVAAGDPVVAPQTTFEVSQLIEVGGKRAARRNFAARTRDLAAWDYETARIDVLTRVTHAFVDVLAAQQMVSLTAQTSRLVAQAHQGVIARVAAGVVSPIEETRANVELAAVRVESNRAIRLLEASRRRLAANWGATGEMSPAVAGDLDVISAVPSLSELTTRLAQNPEVARWEVEILQREAALATEKSRRLPDVTLSAGYRQFSELRTTAYVIGASIPLPVFDRNTGAVREAESRVAKGYEERRAAGARISTALAEAYRVLAGAHDELTELRTTVLPGSRQAFDAVSEGYRMGKFGFLDVLDAQRTLIAANAQYLRALSDYHKAVADVERLTGAPLRGKGDVP